MRAFLFIGCCLVLTSCFDKGDCLFSNTNVVKVNFKKLETPSQADTVAFDSVFVPDWKYFIARDTISAMALVADPRTTETTYVFQYGERSDTLVLSYTKQVIVLSPDCGSYIFQRDLAVKYSTFGTDRVVIRDPQLLTSVPLNVEIFF